MEFECPQGWRLAKLKELGEVNRGRSRHRPRHAAHLYGGPYPFIQTGDVKASGGRITSYKQTYSEAGLEQSRLWPAGTMCITIAANIAETGVLEFSACFPDSVIGFIADDKKCDVYFVEYMFRFLKRYLQHEAGDSGTVQDNINLGTLDQLRFPLPPLSEQKEISAILCTLDDKIELNRQMSHTLEAMAQAIFKSWFVDFDPVTAKAAGRKPYGTDDETATLFPSRLVAREQGLIPEGWNLVSFSTLVEIHGGGTPKTSVAEYWGGTIPWFSVVDTPSSADIFVIDTEKKITNAALENSAAKLLPMGATIITARGTVGNLAIVGKPMAINQSCYALTGRDGYGPYFIYFAANELIDELCQRTHGSVFDTIIRSTFDSVLVAAPPAQLAERYDRAVSPLLTRTRNNLEESRTLAMLRDALLPKLLSGDLRIPHAEKIVGEVA